MTSTSKQRHGCVTAWLIFMIIANASIAVLYLFAGDKIAQTIPGGISNPLLMALAVLGIANILFSVLLFKWMKIGFWGFVLTSIAALVVNTMAGLGIGQSLSGLVGIAVLFAVLQIRKDGVSAWANMGNPDKPVNANKKPVYKSAKTIRKEQLEEQQRLEQQAAEEAERLERRKEKEDPRRFMPQ